MSRSIHKTVHQYAELGRWQFADEQEQATQRRKVLEQLIKKRQIGRQVRQERRAATADRWPAVTDEIPIYVEEAAPYVHFPASPDDLRAVMRRLPRGVLDGLERIDLQLGSEDQLEWPHRGCTCELAPDPLVGRPGGQLRPGVYSGHLLGRYHARGPRIRLFAYVYDPSVPDRELLEFELRLHMLETFIHEVAHHDDEMRRTHRGRWLADDKTKNERYAQARQREWFETCVSPYLRESYEPYLRDKYGSRLDLVRWP